MYTYVSFKEVVRGVRDLVFFVHQKNIFVIIRRLISTRAGFGGDGRGRKRSRLRALSACPQPAANSEALSREIVLIHQGSGFSLDP